MGAGDRLVTVPGATLMPSYRVAVDVHGVAPGTAPETLLPRVAELLGRTPGRHWRTIRTGLAGEGGPRHLGDR